MAEKIGYVSLDECVAATLDENEISVTKRYKHWQLAFRAMEQLGIDFFFLIESVKLPVSSTKTVDMPTDMHKYTKIGVLNDVGEIIPLSYNSKLTSFADLQTDRISRVEDASLFNLFQWNQPIWYNYWNGDGFTNLYGLPSGEPFLGGFKIDEDNRVIILDPNFNYSYVMVEYVKTPRQDGEYRIPIEFKEAVIAFIDWKCLPYKAKGTGAWANLKHNFYNERRLANARYKPLYLDEAYEWSLKNQRLTVKA